MKWEDPTNLGPWLGRVTASRQSEGIHIQQSFEQQRPIKPQPCARSEEASVLPPGLRASGVSRDTAQRQEVKNQSGEWCLKMNFACGH